MTALIVLVSISVLVPVAGMVLYAVFSTPKPQDNSWDGDASNGGGRFD